jgi:RHS repeat-associated protein
MPSTHRVRFASQNVSIMVSALLLLLFLSTHSSGQTTQTTTDKMTPSGITPGAPAGSYPLTGLESVNLFNGNLDFHLPLLALEGRGSAVRNMMLSLNTKKWRVRESHTQTSDTYTPTTVNWGSVEVGYLAGKLQGRQSGWSSRTCTNPKQTRYYYTNTKLTFVAPDGTEYDLRDQLTDGQPVVANQCGGIQGASRGTLFKTSDGSGVTFISDSTIYDKTSIPTGQAGSWNLIVSGYLLLRDGTRYRIDSGNVSWIRDRNGNLVYSQTDAINRQITMTTLPDGSDQITYKGYQGALRTIIITHTSLGSALRAGYSLQTQAQLFPELLGGYNLGTYNPTIVSAVILPDGRSYQFRYNSYGELARVVLPTGGAIEYDMTAGSGVVQGSGSYGLEYQIYRRVVERRTYVDGTTLESRTTYSANGGTTGVSHYNSAGTLLALESHSYYGDPAASLFAPVEGGFYSDWHEGKEYSTSYYATDGTTVLKTVTNTWEQRASVSWYPSQYYNAGNEPANDPRIIQTVTTLVDTNQVSKTTYSYDQYNNQTDGYEYDYGAGVAGALIRHTHTDYVNTNPVNGTDYTATGVYLRSLPSQTSVFDAGGVERSRTSFEYDNYAADGNHWPLTDRANISGHDSGFTTGYPTRGNLTATTHYLLTNGIVTGSVTAYSQFDIAGNLTKAIDARGYATTIDYDDRFGAPDGDARSNMPPSELAGLSSFAFATKLTNALGQTVYGQYDYYLGQPVDGEDFNGIVASGYYNDALDRPTQVRRAVATAAAGQSTFSYDDPNRSITVTSDLNANNDNALLTKTLYDGLGRTTESRQYESGTNYIAVQTQYDGLGRACKTSNPFRPYLFETAVWTTTAFDALSRATSVTTPDTAVMTTAYSGNAVTVTDQGGKLRRSISDAVGRLTRVDEPDANNNLDSGGSPIQPTYYTYDVLDDLTGVSQGVQSRTFVSDSLKRLTSATNPESGTVNYGYDANGNLTSKVDARSITTTIAYDAINRITSKSYNDNPQTPTISYFYDAQTLPAGAPTFSRGYSTGRLIAVTYGSGSEGTYRGYDEMGRVVTQYQSTDSANYLVEATYYANSALHTQTYPAVPGAGDRRVVSYTNDPAGRLGSLNSNATTYAPAARVSSIGYAAHNALNTETYGNGLIHAVDYNNRLQPTQIKLGTSGSPTSIVSLGYSYGTTNNNGNVLTHTYSGGGLSYTQSFGYDSLNRLTTSNENSGASWSQTNGYDRYGNRWIDLGGGNQSLYFNTSNNRISGGSYDSAGNLLNDGLHAYSYDAENKIVKVDNVSAYTYNGEGQRVRKLVGENLRFVYGIGGQLIAEFSGSTGALQKEYIYGASNLLATIEPTSVNANGTRYTTPDHLGSPRVVTNSAASVLSRHDHMPFGEEIGSGVGGRTVGMGFGVAEGLRKKFTSHERDSETGLDYMRARYYSSGQGRLSSSDPLLASGDSRNPQSWNRYAYVLNNPVRLIDPNGLDDAEATDSQEKKQVVNPLEDKAINKRLDEIRQNAKPLGAGETPKPTTVEVIQGEQTVLQNATIDVPEPDQDIEVDNGYMQTIALVVLDQGNNIMVDPNLSLTESAKPDSPDAKALYEKNKALTTNAVAISQQANGAFYDLQVRQFDPNKQVMNVKTKQDAVVKSGTTNVFMVQGTEIRMNDASKSITYKQGPVRKFGN